jgi:hypothetical protein
MYKEVILQSFDKGKIDIPGKTTKTQIAEHISIVLLNEYKVQVSGRTLRNLFDNANTIAENKDLSINSNFVNALCNYLGYKDYDHFTKDYKIGNDNRLIPSTKKHWIVILVCLITVSSVIVFLNHSKQQWMQWDGNKYVVVKFDKKKYEADQLKPLSSETINNFYRRKPNCETSFFDDKGFEKLWYGKTKNKDLEFFSSLGRHPETGKTLKPITTYIIKKYICESY